MAEDDSGLCGYLAASLDSKKFWTKYELAYLPDMREKYGKPTVENDKELSETEVSVTDIVPLLEVDEIVFWFRNSSCVEFSLT